MEKLAPLADSSEKEMALYRLAPHLPLDSEVEDHPPTTAVDTRSSRPLQEVSSDPKRLAFTAATRWDIPAAVGFIARRKAVTLPECSPLRERACAGIAPDGKDGSSPMFRPRATLFTRGSKPCLPLESPSMLGPCF
jgi:hypothetical protein